MDEGMSSNCIYVIFRDKSGTMWFGTNEGLDAYDGYSIHKFAPMERDTTSIEGKIVFGIREYEPNKITVALGDRGINVYDKRTHRFLRESRYTPDSSIDFGSALGLGRLGDYAYAVYPTAVAKRNIHNRQEVTHYIDRPKETHRDAVGLRRVITKRMPGVSGNIAMLLSSCTIGVLDTKYENIAEAHFGGGKIYDISPLDAEHLILATSSGLWGFDIRSKRFTQMGVLRGKMVQSLCRNTDGDYWVAYDGDKLVKWMPSQGKIARVEGCNRVLNRQTRINDIYEDDNGLLWLATSNRGVIKIDTKHPKIQTQFIHNDMPTNYATNDISVVDANTLWAACGETGLVKVNLKTSTSEIIPIKGAEAVCVLARNNGSVFVGTTNGIWRYNSQQRALYQLSFGDEKPDSTASALVRGLNEDCLGNIWVSTRAGLYRFNGVQFEKMLTDDGHEYSFNTVYEDEDGRIWAGSSSGLFLRGVGEKTFKRIGKKWSGRDGEGILSIEGYKNLIFIGTSDGIGSLDRRTCEQVSNTVFSRFDNRAVYSIVKDKNDVIWVNTNSEVGYVDVNYGNVYAFSNRDGLYSDGDECRNFVLHDDIIYFGQVGVVNTINTRNISFNTRMPSTYISEIIYGQSGAETTMTMSNDTTFSHLYLTNSSMKIHVASSDYTNPSRNQFMFRMNDGEWQRLSGSNEILISGLLPGTYRIMLRSSNADMTWSYDVATFYIRLDSPLWLSRPAVLFYAIWLMAIVWLILNLRFRKINKRMRLAEAEAKSKSIVEDQRNKLVRAINEQHASFNYAKRIQDALMPKVSSVERYFSKFFVLYKPKEIVSGDFYTFYHRDDKTFVISADCTGHGVPGAFISILGIDHISNIIQRQNIDDAGEILTQLQRELRSAVSKIGSIEVNDGMDITISVIYHKEKKINFAGAMNDLYLIRNNEVFVYRGDRLSIGVSIFGDEQEIQSFKSTTIECQSGDMFYMFSDGYCDQFGGPEHKKFKVRRFKNLLLNVHKLPANDQRLLLNQKLVEWMGNVDQTDDISVIGFEPWA